MLESMLPSQMTFSNILMMVLLSLISILPLASCAQELPSLNMPENNFNISYRSNVCAQHDRYIEREIELRDGLQGLQLSTIARVGEYFYVDENGAIAENPGLVGDILDELASRAGFTWRNSFSAIDGPAENQTWTELLLWSIEKYDLCADWWIHSSTRLKNGVGFPKGFVDASYIMVSVVEREESNEEKVDIFACLRPFDPELWIAILVTVVISGILYSVVEKTNMEKKRWKVGSSVFGTLLITLQHFHMRPKTRAGKLLSGSVAFWSLVVVTTYTANLASHFVLEYAPTLKINSIEDAVRSEIAMCVWKDTAINDYVAKHFPRGIYVPTEGSSDHLSGVRDGKCGVAIAAANAWEEAQGNSAINPHCNLEWIGRTINFQEAGFALKSDSGRLCTSFIQDALNIHIVDMWDDGTMDLLREKHTSQVHDIDCAVENAASNAEEENTGQLTLKEMAGPFIVHSVATAIALILASVALYGHKRKKNKETDTDSIDQNDNLNNTDEMGQSAILPLDADEQDVAEANELMAMRTMVKNQAKEHKQLANNLADFASKQKKMLECQEKMLECLTLLSKGESFNFEKPLQTNGLDDDSVGWEVSDGS